MIHFLMWFSGSDDNGHESIQVIEAFPEMEFCLVLVVLQMDAELAWLGIDTWWLTSWRIRGVGL